MIVGEYFKGDSTWAAWIQHDVYGEVVSYLFRAARETYGSAYRVVGVETALAKDVKVRTFDHRTLQYVHDMIAARFRFLYLDRFQPQFPGLLDDLSDEQRVLGLWREFYPKEIARLLDENSELPRLILTAAVYPDPDERGIAAESQLYDLLKTLYPEIHT